ncbi:CPBP family intramembrane glutamic endopeptidase [Arcanobacterium bovis]|uniref:CPBP family intramembrane metalloprotease n=1 Tax=Arcanobacterium bovis TaxID=2529275 RepID=A0A4Q9V215_9ACTO|nr:CPBP family intramembrane glutamic endopeptidase [Arcanobacterium bovis]TBW23679.1 CPBP family intramembrane metalloprotease [Arcanobacterium bovis]
MQIFGEIEAFFRAALVDPVATDHATTALQLRQRRIVVIITMMLGTGALGWALAIKPGNPIFYLATLSVAAIWAIGSFISGPLYLGRSHTRKGATNGRAILQGIILGGVLLIIFLLGAMVAGQVSALRHPVDELLAHAIIGSLALTAVITAVTGICEELFFRGAVYAALPRRWATVGSALLYTGSTILSGVLLLSFAAFILGILTGAQRRVTGGIAGPIAAHLTWSMGMLFLLPHALNLGDLLW